MQSYIYMKYLPKILNHIDLRGIYYILLLKLKQTSPITIFFLILYTPK